MLTDKAMMVRWCTFTYLGACRKCPFYKCLILCELLTGLRQFRWRQVAERGKLNE